MTGRIFTTGAEEGDLLRWSAWAGGTPSAQTSVKRNGNYAFVLPSVSTAGGTTITTRPASAMTEFSARFAIRYSVINVGLLFSWWNNTNAAGSVRLAGWGSGATYFTAYDGASTLRDTSSFVSLLQNEWHVIEVYVKIAASGIIKVKFDGTVILSFAGATNAQASVDRFQFAINTPTGANMYLDDIAIDDRSGLGEGWIGDGGMLTALVPTGAGQYTDLAASAGSPYACVDDIPANTTDYISSSTLNQKSTFVMSDLSGMPTGATIQRVTARFVAQQSAAGGDKIAALWRTGAGTDVQEADQALTTAWTEYLNSRTVNPDTGAAWTESEVNALQLGVVVR